MSKFKNADSDLWLVLPAIHLFIPCHLPALGIVVGDRTQRSLTCPCPGVITVRDGKGESAWIRSPVCPAGPKLPSGRTLPITASVGSMPKVQGHDRAPGGGLASCHHLSPRSDTYTYVGT